MHIFSYLIIFTSTEVLLETSVVWSAAKLFCFIYFCYSQKWLKNVKHLLLFPDLALISAFALQMTRLDFFLYESFLFPMPRPGIKPMSVSRVALNSRRVLKDTLPTELHSHCTLNISYVNSWGITKFAFKLPILNLTLSRFLSPKRFQ